MIIERIRDVNAIQTLNAIFQYCPQVLFQSYLIIYRHYKCIITGVSAGLACFSFLWHIFIHFFYMIKRFNDEFSVTDLPLNDDQISNQIIDNLSTSPNENAHQLVSTAITNSTTTTVTGNVDVAHLANTDGTDIISHHPTTTLVPSLPQNFKDFEKPMYKTDDKNFVVSKKHGTKSVEKTKIFSFNKRRPIYEKEEFDMISEINNLSTVFFEVNDSSSALTNKIDASNKDLDNFRNENQINNSLSCSIGSVKCMDDHRSYHKIHASIDDLKRVTKKDTSNDSFGFSDSVLSISGSRNSLLKRKGICSSQEMLHLVDIMNDNISPEQVDVLAKSLVELGGGGDSLTTESEHDIPDNATLLEQFPEVIDEKLLENIDAAIYENQIIFQERIRKNQLTIQNLKLQDQLLSKCIEDMKLIPYNETMSIRDYENMCFANIAGQNRGMKHWRNYLQNINSNQHDNSTVQHSSFYMNTNTNTVTNSFTDLYINENDIVITNSNRNGAKASGFTATGIATAAGCDDDCSVTSPIASTVGDESMLLPCYKKITHWQAPKLSVTSNDGTKDICDNECLGENLYINMVRTKVEPRSGITSEKNILVETINKISIVDSPVKSLLVTSDKTSTNMK